MTEDGENACPVLKVKALEPAAATNTLSLKGGGFAFVAKCECNALKFPIMVILERNGYRILPLDIRTAFSTKRELRDVGYAFLKHNTLPDGVYLHFSYNDKRLWQRFVFIAYYSKDDIELAAMKRPLIPYGREADINAGK